MKGGIFMASLQSVYNSFEKEKNNEKNSIYDFGHVCAACTDTPDGIRGD